MITWYAGTDADWDSCGAGDSRCFTIYPLNTCLELALVDKCEFLRKVDSLFRLDKLAHSVF